MVYSVAQGMGLAHESQLCFATISIIFIDFLNRTVRLYGADINILPQIVQLKTLLINHSPPPKDNYLCQIYENIL